jgi:hypothetical protein
MTEHIQFTGRVTRPPSEDIRFVYGTHGRVTRRQYGDDPQPEGAGTLGKLRQTERGFEIITFHDRYNQACSLQQSSLAFESAIWLGISGNRMHLTEGHVMDLMERLSAVWLANRNPLLKVRRSASKSPAATRAGVKQ